MKVVVGIDQAQATSGFAGVVRFRPAVWGLARNADERRDAIRRMVDLAGGELAEVLWVFEDHGKIPLWYKAEERSTDGVLGLGEAAGRWKEQLELLGVTDSRVLKVPPVTWRSAVLKRCKPGQDWKGRALEYVATMPGCAGVDDHNVAEALCIAMWGAFAGVAKREQKRVATNYYARERRRRQGVEGPRGDQLELGGGKESA